MFTQNIVDPSIGYPEMEVMIPIGVSIRCAKCNEGYLDYTGDHDGSVVHDFIMPKKYEHKCSNELCDNHVFLDSFYPAIEYKSMNSLTESDGYQ